MTDTAFATSGHITASRTAKMFADNGTIDGYISVSDILALIVAGDLPPATSTAASYPGSFSVLAYGAVGDNSADDGPAFNRAVAAAGSQGLVVVPPAPGGTAYKWKTPVSCTAGASLCGIGRPQITWECSTTSADALTFGVGTGEQNTAPYLEGLRINGSGTSSLRGRDLVRISSGIRLQVRDLHLFQSGRDAFHMEVANDGGYIECTQVSNLSAFKSGRDGVRIETGNFNASTSVTYINQTVFYMVDVRDPGQGSGGGYCLSLINNATSSNANGKISCLTFINGELCATGNQQADGIWMAAPNSGTIENVAFNGGVTIEDVNAAHSGYAVNGTKGSGASIGNINMDGQGIVYGFSSGRFNRNVIGA